MVLEIVLQIQMQGMDKTHLGKEAIPLMTAHHWEEDVVSPMPLLLPITISRFKNIFKNP